MGGVTGMPAGASGEGDYRTSHLAKGADYDAALESRAFDAYMARVERDLLLRIVPRLFPDAVPRYLDFACGTGRITQTVGAFAGASIGVDVSASMVEQARLKCPATQFILRDLTTEPLEVESPFDLITSFRFLGNAETTLRRDALRALHGLLAPGGYLIVNNHRNALSLHNLLLRLRGRSDGSNLTLRALRALLDETGFTVMKVYGIGAWLLRHRLRRRSSLESRWARGLEPISRLPGIGRYCPDMIVVARRV